MKMDFSLLSARVIRSLERIIEWRGKPLALCFDSEPEYISQQLIDFASQKQTTPLNISGKQAQNAYAERFNRTVRDEWLDLHSFEGIDQAQLLATQWLWLYDNECPHTAIGGMPPAKLLEAA